jgi:hypothetical protein
MESILVVHVMQYRSLVKSVGVVTDLGLDDQGSIVGRARDKRF